MSDHFRALRSKGLNNHLLVSFEDSYLLQYKIINILKHVFVALFLHEIQEQPSEYACINSFQHFKKSLFFGAK